MKAHYDVSDYGLDLPDRNFKGAAKQSKLSLLLLLGWGILCFLIGWIHVLLKAHIVHVIIAFFGAGYSFGILTVWIVNKTWQKIEHNLEIIQHIREKQKLN